MNIYLELTKEFNEGKLRAVIGELARIMTDPTDQLLTSRSARDLIELGQYHPQLARELVSIRPALGGISKGLEHLEVELDAERRSLMHANEKRLQSYAQAARSWASQWPQIASRADDLSLMDAHHLLVQRAEGVLPFELEEAYE